jgi:hypothetical protein
MIHSCYIGVQRIRNLLGTLFALVIADGLITEYLVIQGIGKELNPFISTLLEQNNFLMLKVFGALLSILILWHIYKKIPRITAAIVVGWVIAYTGIVYWNVFAYFIASA